MTEQELYYCPQGTCLHPNHHEEDRRSVDSAHLLGAVINRVCLVSSFAGCQDTEELL